MESRYGPLGSGAQRLSIGGTEYRLEELLAKMGLRFDDCRGIDLLTLSAEHFVVRYYDGQDQRVVAQEFDAGLRLLGETRAHVAEWVGEEAYYSFFSGH